MATEIEQARQQINLQRQRVEQVRSQLEQAREQSQRSLRQQSGIAGRGARQQTEQSVREQTQVLKETEKEISSYESQVTQAEAAQREAENIQAQYATAYRVMAGGKGDVSDIPKEILAEVSEYARTNPSFGNANIEANKVYEQFGKIYEKVPSVELSVPSSQVKVGVQSKQPSLADVLGGGTSNIGKFIISGGKVTGIDTGTQSVAFRTASNVFTPKVNPVSRNPPTWTPPTYDIATGTYTSGENKFSMRQSDVPKGTQIINTKFLEAVKQRDTRVKIDTRQSIPTISSKEQWKGDFGARTGKSYVDPTIQKREQVRRINDIQENIVSLSNEANKIVQRNKDIPIEQWSQEDLNKYNEKIEFIKVKEEDYRNLGGSITEEGEFVSPTDSVGLFGLTKEVPITELYTGKVAEPFTIFEKTVGATVGVGTTKGLNKLGYEPTTTEFERQVYRTETMQYNPLTGSYETPKIKFTYISPTAEEIGSKVGKGVEFGLSTGKYFIPYFGTGLAALEAGEILKEYDFKPIEYFKKEPLQATILTVGLLAPLLVKGAGVLTKPIFITEKLVQAERGAVTLVGKASKVVKKGGQTVTLFDNIIGTSQVVREGIVTKVTNPLKQFLGARLKLSGKGFELLPSKSFIYSGIPTGKVGKAEYNKVLELLTKRGYTESQARNLIRLRRPQIVENVFKGSAKVVEGGKGTRILLEGTQKEIPTLKEISGIKTRLGEGRFRTITAEGVPVEGGKGGIELFRFNELSKEAFLSRDLVPFSKIRKAGRTETTFDIVSGVKQIGEGNILIKGGKDLAVYKPLEFYKEADISKTIIPKVRKVSSSKSLVGVEKGDADVIIDLDEVLGITPTIGIQGGTKKSSGQFLQNMFKTPEEGLASGLSKVVKSETIPIQVPEIKTIVTTTRVKPVVLDVTQKSQFTGTGQYERTEETGGGFTMTGLVTGGTEREYQPLSIREIQIEPTKEVLLNIAPTRFKEFSTQIPQMKSQQKEVQVPKEVLQLKTKQLQKLLQLVRTKQIKKTPTQIIPKIPKIRLPKLPSSSTSPKKSAKEILLGETFEVFKRTKGEDVSVGEEFSLGKAGEKFSKVLRESLSASGYVKEKRTGRKVSFRELAPFLGEGFAPSKVESSRIIQVKSKRLSSGSEVWGIQSARKSKSKKNRWL